MLPGYPYVLQSSRAALPIGIYNKLICSVHHQLYKSVNEPVHESFVFIRTFTARKQKVMINDVEG